MTAGERVVADLPSLVLEASTDPFVVIEAGGTVRAWSQSAVGTFGYSKEEAIGRRIVDLIIPGRDRSEHERVLAGMAQSGGTDILAKGQEMIVQRKDGVELDVEITIVVISLGEDRAFGIFLRDVSEIRRARLEQQRLATIVETSSDAIVSGTPEGIILSWNEAAERLYGYRADEMIGQHLAKILPPVSREMVAEVRDRLVAGKPVHEVETTVLHKDGHLVEISVSVGALVDPDGNVYGLSASARDITERRIAQRALHELRGHMTGAFENAPIGMALVATDGTFLAVNHSLCELLQRNADELIGRDFQGITHPEDLESDLHQLERVLAGEIDAYELEKRYLLPGGGIVWGRLCVSLVRDQDGMPVHFISQIQDITGQKSSEADLRRRAERLTDLSVHDPLTGLTNQREFDSVLQREVERAHRYDGELSLIIFDVDDFRALNEEHGRARGDQVLRFIAHAIVEVPRLPDLAARMGDDHFALLLPSTDPAGAAAVARRVSEQLRTIDGLAVHVSHGIAGLDSDPLDTADHLLVRAEAALRASRPEQPDLGTVSDTTLRPRARERIRRVLALARQQLGMDVTLLTEFVDSRQIYRVLEGEGLSFGMHEGDDLAISDTLCAKVLAGETGGAIPDVSRSRAAAGLASVQAGRIGAYAGAPIRLPGGTLFGTICGVSHEAKPGLGARDRELLVFLGEMLGALLEQEVTEVSERQAAVELSGVHALVAALEARDEYTGEHSKTVVALARDVARRLGLSTGQSLEVEQVAILHDVGKVGIPDSILQKQGPLSDDEWAMMRQHPAIGERIIAGTQSLAHLAPAIRAEHERYDGDGYPDGLRGAAIPIASRITLACDAYHAMRSDRPYRAALAPDAAKAELRRCSGTQFDPNVIEALLDAIECGDAGAAPLAGAPQALKS